MHFIISSISGNKVNASAENYVAFNANSTGRIALDISKIPEFFPFQRNESRSESNIALKYGISGAYPLWWRETPFKKKGERNKRRQETLFFRDMLRKFRSCSLTLTGLRNKETVQWRETFPCWRKGSTKSKNKQRKRKNNRK